VTAAVARDPSARPRPRVILNASAGRKAGLPTNDTVAAEDIEALFRAHGADVEVLATESEEASVEATLAAVRDACPAVVAAGGDGTFGVVARALLDAAGAHPGVEVPPLGVLPLGSAMNVARSLGVPRDLEAAAGIIVDGHSRPIDVGVLGDGTTFFEALAIGLHAELFAEAAAFDEGDLLAPLRAAWTAVRYRPSRVTLALDDRTVATRALVLSVSNGPFTGLGFTVAPEARMDDGRFDIRVFERFSRLELLLHFGSIALGRRRYEPRVRTFRSARVGVASASPLRVRVDGEDAGETPVEATVRPGALRVLVPRPGPHPPA
jgi:YegS/Rv2252/BmrU family lipid kinase